jgi:hypothetical protein
VFPWHDQGKACAKLKTPLLIKHLSAFCPESLGQAAENRWFTLVFVASQRQAMSERPVFDELVF